MESVLISEPRGLPRLPAPRALPSWRLSRVMSGHTGWVYCVAPDPINNSWLATGSADRTIKLWDVASGRLLLTLTGHVAGVRGLAASPRHPYLFSCGEDRQIKCWDLETNRVVRHFHGHLHAVNAVQVHPALDFIGTAGRDSTARLWDMRSRACVHTLTGHRDAVHDLAMNDCRPQLVTGSADSTIRLWDIVSGRTYATLTHHKKGVRGLALGSGEHTMASAAGGGRIKRWALPEGRFLHDMSCEPDSSTIWNCVDINADGVLAAGSDDGLLSLHDYRNGDQICAVHPPVQPGSLECEAGILAVCFDLTGLRLFAGGVDKTVSVFKPVED